MLSINATLKTIIAIFAIALVYFTAHGAWISWNRLIITDQVAKVSDATASIFDALNNIRWDRSNNPRLMAAEGSATDLVTSTRTYRAKEMPALQTTIERLKAISFDGREAVVADLQTKMESLKALHLATEAEWAKPKSQRSEAVTKEFTEAATLIIDKLSSILATMDRLNKLGDAYIDQMSDLFNLAWNVRVAEGDASAPISNKLFGMKISDGAWDNIPVLLGQADGLWRALQQKQASLHLPQRVTDAIAQAKSAAFSDEARGLPGKMMAALVTGSPLPISQAQWSSSRLSMYESLVNISFAAIESARETANAAHHEAMLELIIQSCGLVLALVFSSGSMLLVTRRITRPLTQMTACMSRIASGSFQEVIPGTNRSDEIGGMAAAVEVFRSSLLRNQDLEAESARTRDTAERQRKAMLLDLAAQFETRVGGIVDAVAASATALDGAAKVMSQSAIDTSHRSTAVAAAAEEASANVTVVASSAEELGASVSEISRQVQQSTDMSSAAVEEARATASIVSELSTAAGRISDVLGLISTIAGQTNLLALNATIEAARAGEAGRGFAIVASEVKELANQTAKATAEIATQIGSIQSSTERAVGAIGGIAETIQSMNHVATMISASVSQQGAATSEIVRNISQASAGTSEVTDNITGVARAAGDTGNAANEVLGASATLAERATQLRAEVDRFVTTVRAA
jgi:methyl-accepting chemotaxis protein